MMFEGGWGGGGRSGWRSPAVATLKVLTLLLLWLARNLVSKQVGVDCAMRVCVAF